MAQNVLALVVPAEPEESAAFLSGVAQAKGLSLPAGLDLGAILKLLAENPALLSTLLPLILGLLKDASGPGVGKPGELPTPVKPTPPEVEKTEPEEPVEEEGEDASTRQFVDSFTNTKCVDLLDKTQAKIGTREQLESGAAVQMVKQRVRLNTDPSFRGRKYPGNDPTLNGPLGYGRDGKPNAPRIQWRWRVDGVMASNSEGMPDPFHLGSYEDNAGTTPSLKLEQAGPGRRKVEAWPLIEAKDNGGVEVSGESDAATWFID